MRRHTSRFLAASAFILGACVDAPTSVRIPTTAQAHSIPISSPEVEFFVLCKAGPVGTYSFDVTATHQVLWNSATNAHDLSSASYSITVNAGSTIDIGGTVEQGACATFTTPNGNQHNHVGLAGGFTDATATAVETTVPAGTVFDRVVTYQNVGGGVTTTSSQTNSASGRLGGNGTGIPGLTGSAVVFYNKTVPVFSGNSINVQTVRVLPTLVGGYVNGFSGSFDVIAFDQPVTVSGLSFKVSRNGDKAFWQGSCSTSPAAPFNVGKSSTVAVSIAASCAVAGGPAFKKGDDVRLEVIATLVTGRVFSNSGFYKIP